MKSASVKPEALAGAAADADSGLADSDGTLVSGTAPADCEKPGSAVKNSVAMRWRTAGSGKLAGNAEPGIQLSAAPTLLLAAGLAAGFAPAAPDFGSLRVMIIADFNVLERGDRVVSENRG